MLAPRQFGIGHARATEGLSHSLRRLIASTQEAGMVLLKVDFRNAFNLVDRTSMLGAVARWMPELMPYALWAYGSKTPYCSRGRYPGFGRRLGCNKATPLVRSSSASASSR